MASLYHILCDLQQLVIVWTSLHTACPHDYQLLQITRDSSQIRR